MTRVAIIGNAGAGKSTLAAALSRTLGLPHLVLDRILWREGWRLAPADEVRAEHRRLIAAPGWIIDGLGPLDIVAERLAAADTIVFVDPPLWRLFWQAAKRQLVSLFRPDPFAPEGCRLAAVGSRMARMIWRLHWDQRSDWVDLVDRHAATRRVFWIRHREDRRRLLSAAVAVVEAGP